MKRTGLFFIFLFTIWKFSVLAALAQNEDPFHCDSLKTLCFDESKIKVRYFNAPKTCAQPCNFCNAVTKQDWLQVQNQLKQQVKPLPFSPEKPGNLRNWLLAHRLVNFVLPPENQKNLKTELQIGFQVPYMTYTWNVTFEQKIRKKAPYWKFTRFEVDHQIFSRLNALGANFQKLLQSDSLQLPPPLLPDQNYLASWFGTRNLSPEDYAALEKKIRNNAREAVKDLIEKKL